jgi:release factor glutamine methyltransferase
LKKSFKHYPALRQRRGLPCDFEEFDVIISNPPYIPVCGEINRGAEFDPGIALYGGQGGLVYYRQIARIKNGKKIYLEIGMGQHDAVRKIFESEGWKFVRAFNDLSGIVRVLVLER